VINNLSQKKPVSCNFIENKCLPGDKGQVFMFSLYNLVISNCAQHGKSGEKTIEEIDRGLVICIVMCFVRKD